MDFKGSPLLCQPNTENRAKSAVALHVSNNLCLKLIWMNVNKIFLMDCIVPGLSYVSPVHIGSCWALCYLYSRHPSIGRICQESWWWLVSLPPGSIISATSATGQFIIIVINIPSMQCRRVRSRKTERMASTNSWVIGFLSLKSFFSCQ